MDAIPGRYYDRQKRSYVKNFPTFPRAGRVVNLHDCVTGTLADAIHEAPTYLMIRLLQTAVITLGIKNRSLQCPGEAAFKREGESSETQHVTLKNILSLQKREMAHATETRSNIPAHAPFVRSLN